MRAYYDGSWTPKSSAIPQAEQILAWGIVFDDGEITEISGARTARGSEVTGSHEVVAFIECALYCVSHNIAPEDVSFTTDDELTAYGSKATVANGYSCTSHGAALEAILLKLVKIKMYDAETVASVASVRIVPRALDVPQGPWSSHDAAEPAL